MSRIVIGICGSKTHGKDTAAQPLIEKYGFTHINFADGLRKTVCTALREPLSFFTDPATKDLIDPRTGLPRREWLTKIGTEGFRSMWDSVWSEWWNSEVKETTGNIVVTDLRFPNELELIRAFPDNLVIRITNPNKPIIITHVSEAHFQDFLVDYDISNGGSIADLHRETLSVIRENYKLGDN
jgi:hypothetical protein